MQDIPNFWDKTHQLSAQAEELYEKFVPAAGTCDTLQGELLRASSKIGYDWYNNGWGCNNWSGAVVFLKEHISDLPEMAEDSDSSVFHDALNQVHEFSHGEPVRISDARADQLVTHIHEYVVKKILANPLPIPNTLDMWDFSEPDYVPDEEDFPDFWNDEDDDL